MTVGLESEVQNVVLGLLFAVSASNVYPTLVVVFVINSVSPALKNVAVVVADPVVAGVRSAPVGATEIAIVVVVSVLT